MSNFTKQLWDQKKRLIFNLVFFILSKSAVFIAPLLLSNALSVDVYGSLEYGISIGSILAMIGGLGISPYPILIIRERRTEYFSSFVLYICGIFMLGLLFVAASLLLPIQESVYGWAGLICFVIIVQSFLSTVFKTHAKQRQAVFIDSGLYVFLIGFVGLTQAGILHYKHLFGSIEVYLLFVILFTLLAFRSRIRVSKNDVNILKKILMRGFPLIIGGFLMMCLTNSGRILIERFCTKEQLGIYSFYFRLASCILLFHQFVGIMFFKKLFTATFQKLDKYYTGFFFLMLMVSIGGYLLIPLAGKDYLKLLSTLPDNRELYFLLATLVVFWSISSLNESLIYRENLAGRMNFSLITVFVLSAVLLMVVNHYRHLTPVDVVKMHFGLLYVVLQIQIILLRVSGHKLTKLQIATTGAFICVFLIDNIFLQ